MISANNQKGIAIVSLLMLALWVAFSAYAMSLLATYATYQVFQDKIRFVGLAVAGTTVVIGYLIANLRDLRKQIKDEPLALSRREVANINHLITIGYKKAIAMLLTSPIVALFLSSAAFWDIKSPKFIYFIWGAGALIGLTLSFVLIAVLNLSEINKFEEKLSNMSKRRQSAAAALKKFKGEKTD